MYTDTQDDFFPFFRPNFTNMQRYMAHIYMNICTKCIHIWINKHVYTHTQGELFPFFRPNFTNMQRYMAEHTPFATSAVAFIPSGWADGSSYNRRNCSQVNVVAVCCSLLQCFTVCCDVLQRVIDWHLIQHLGLGWWQLLQLLAGVCCSELQCVAVCCIVAQCGAVWCSVLQCVAICYRLTSGTSPRAGPMAIAATARRCVLQCVAVCCSVLQRVVVCDRLLRIHQNIYDMYVAVCCSCCSVLQCVTVCCSVLQCVAVCCIVLQCVAVCCIVSHRVAVCCSVLQCVAVLVYVSATAATARRSRFNTCAGLFEFAYRALFIHVYGSCHTHTGLFWFTYRVLLTCYFSQRNDDVLVQIVPYMGWLRWVGSLKVQVSFAKETYKRDDILQKRPIILRRPYLFFDPHRALFWFMYMFFFTSYRWHRKGDVLVQTHYRVAKTHRMPQVAGHVPQKSHWLHGSFANNDI